MQTIKFYTLGCKVNQYETQSMREQFLRGGFKELENTHPADVYVINTCTVTHRADADSLGYIRRAKRENPQAKIVVTGCLVELDAGKIRTIDGASLIVKNKNKDKILSWFIGRNTQYAIRNTGGISCFKGHTRAFLKVQDGCDNACSYCKVPLVRGRSRSRPLNEIIQEAKQLAENGFKEIVLCGICLGSYGKDLEPRANLVEVISALEDIEGLLRIRLSSIELGDVSEELIDKMSVSRKLCPHLHIPIQSGNDAILKMMHRKYCRGGYLNLVKKIKSRIPQVAVTTDCLVGFPGESEVQFQDTLDLLKEILPLKVHIFPYSRREGTPAATSFKDEVAPAIIKERILRLKNIAGVCAQEYKKQFLNKLVDVLIEGRAKDNPGFLEGYTDNYIRVPVRLRRNLKNQLIRVRLKKIVKGSVLAVLS